jgi:hypothetical protein
MKEAEANIFNQILTVFYQTGTGEVQSVQCLTTDWMTRFQSLSKAKDFSSSLCVQTKSEAYAASHPMGRL